MSGREVLKPPAWSPARGKHASHTSQYGVHSAGHTRPGEHSPTGTTLSSPLLGTARVCQYPEHVREGTAVGRLGDENALAAEEDQEGHPDADHGDEVAGHKAHVLLNVGDAAQRNDCSQVNAPVKPIEKSPCGFWTSVFNLKQQGGNRL